MPTCRIVNVMYTIPLKSYKQGLDYLLGGLVYYLLWGYEGGGGLLLHPLAHSPATAVLEGSHLPPFLCTDALPNNNNNNKSTITTNVKCHQQC